MLKPTDYLENFFKEVYWKEIERRDKIIATINLPVIIITLIIGGIVYYLPIFPKLINILTFKVLSYIFCTVSMIFAILVFQKKVLRTFFIIALVIVLINFFEHIQLYNEVFTIPLIFVIFYSVVILSTLTAILYVIRVFYGHKFGNIPSPQEIEDYGSGLENYYRSLGIQDVSSQVEIDIKEMLINEYAKQGDLTYWTNFRKSELLHRARGFILTSIICLLICFVPYFILNDYQLTTKKGVTQMKNNVVTKETIENNDKKEIKKPKPPQGRTIKEGELPPPDKGK